MLLTNAPISNYAIIQNFLMGYYYEELLQTP